MWTLSCALFSASTAVTTYMDVIVYFVHCSYRSYYLYGRYRVLCTLQLLKLLPIWTLACALYTAGTEVTTYMDVGVTTYMDVIVYFALCRYRSYYILLSDNDVMDVIMYFDRFAQVYVVPFFFISLGVSSFITLSLSLERYGVFTIISTSIHSFIILCP